MEAESKIEDGTREAFGRLLDEYGPAVARLTRVYEKEESGRHDLAQEIWAAVWSALPRFQGRASMKTWFYRIAHNVACTHAVRGRNDRIKRAEPIESVDIAESSSRDVERSASRREALGRLEKALGEMKALDRQLVMLSLEEVERGEIAEITGLSPENVSVRLSRLRADLTERLARERAKEEAEG